VNPAHKLNHGVGLLVTEEIQKKAERLIFESRKLAALEKRVAAF
jgi:hypothetical protein